MADSPQIQREWVIAESHMGTRTTSGPPIGSRIEVMPVADHLAVMEEREKLRKALTADITTLIGHLDWALRWIEECSEIPVEEDAVENPNFDQWVAARAILEPPARIHHKGGES